MSTPLHILHLEDNLPDAELIQDTLAMAGISCAVTRVETESEFISALQQGGFDLILADYNLPSFDGLSALKIAQRQNQGVPFIFVSGTLGEEVAIESLKIGATDYVLKTRLSRLVPSVQRALREAKERAELRRSEETLRESETRFRTFVDHAGDAFFVYDLEQKTLVDVNREACESLGYSRQELVGKTPFAYHVESYEPEMESVAERAAAGETLFDTHWHRRKDGTVFPVEVHTSLVSYAGRRFLLMVARDISDRVRSEEQRERLRLLEADLAHMNRVTMLSELGASLSHELNQPITGAITSADACLRWLAHEPPDLERARAATLRVKKDGTRAAEIISRLRAFYKKGAPPNREPVNIHEIVNEMVVLLRNEAKRHSVTIRSELPAELPNILADRVPLQQVFMNLMLNAIEAMQHTGGELTIRSQRSDDMLLISISDTGVGLPPDGADQIFDAFFTTKPQGTGMGLAITRSIVEAHGGRLWAGPNTERGATFHFTMPADAGAINEQSRTAHGLHH
jgi:PAS domain S-box-containing protein